MARPSGLKKQTAFLEAFANCGNITAAAKTCGMDRKRHYEWLLDVPDYFDRFQKADAQATGWLEDEATRRASVGVLQAKLYQGKAVASERVYSDGLMMFLLRARNPQKYKAGAIEVTGPGGGPLEIVERLNAALKRVKK